MILTGQRPTYWGADQRQTLVSALQQAHTARRYDSTYLRNAVRAFVREAHGGGMDLPWILVAIQDAIDGAAVPLLTDTERRLISETIRRVAGEADSQCRAGGADQP